MPVSMDTNTIGALPLFRNLTRDQLAWVAERLSRSNYPANSTIFSVDQPAEMVFIIYQGTVRIHVEQASGSDVIIDIGGEGDVLGEMAVIDGGRRSASAFTLEDCVLLWMDRSSFLECLRTMPAVAINLMRLFSGRMRMANDRIQAFASLDVYGRVARHLLSFAHKYGQTLPSGDMLIPIRLTQSDIADLVGASRERVNQIMSFYKQRKYISVDKNYRITIHNAKGLEQHLQ